MRLYRKLFQSNTSNKNWTITLDKFKRVYRIPSARWAAWDYSRNAAYFVTICTNKFVNYFGEIGNSGIQLTQLGSVALDCWIQIPFHFPFVVLDEYIVMPNHVHGIIVIDKPEQDDTKGINNSPNPVETQNFASLQMPLQQLSSRQYPPKSDTPVNQFGPQSQNLASVVRGYKIGVSKFAHQNVIPFKWQARYYDHIIRNTEEYERIRYYINKNPRNWEVDIFYIVNR